MDEKKYPLLAAIDDPLALQRHGIPELEALAEESREFLIETINRTGGHLGAALGVVELTLALFHQFDFLHDRITWDVGHQAHVYKMLTGRASRFLQYGRWGGLCKFLERKESPYDHMGAGHASTSISAAMGLALARDQLGEKHHVVAVIGDGGMTGGLAFEALSMAGAQDLDMMVILNDNGMSIDRNVGALSRRFTRTVTRITTSDSYNAMREEMKRVGSRMPFGTEILKGLKHMERSVKDFVSEDRSAFFESLGFRYFGPVDGHDLSELIPVISHAKEMGKPILLHVQTVKGKGLGPEMENTFEAHAVSPAKTRPLEVNSPLQKSWTRIFSEGLHEIMAADEKVVAITAAMQSNTGLTPMAESFPGRVLDVGIAESNAFCSAAGMAIGGLKPFVTVYSTFTQRAFDQILHDIALQNLPVRIMMDRGGLVGGDGPTHHGVYDHSYLRMIPGIVHMAPRNELELRRMLVTAHLYEDGPLAIRYPRGNTPVMDIPATLEPIPIGQGELLRKPAGKDCLLLVALGTMVETALEVAGTLAEEGLETAVVDARFIKPLDEELLLGQAESARAVLTLEENAVKGGFGEGVMALLAENGINLPVRTLGVPDTFIGYGEYEEQIKACGLDVPRVLETARELAGLSGQKARSGTRIRKRTA
ncbi:MAG: 1-deoxy-D-xylulose-5-phosphate synthase [Deltaproteobacteria bacterium]|nr:1-deoxy-D-xylulose-5-phosphate synthase [Deltaproteobacteria bacterium]